MNAFLDLDGSRSPGMQEGRISWITICDYCERIGIEEDDQRDDVIFLVKGLDDFYLRWLADRPK